MITKRDVLRMFVAWAAGVAAAGSWGLLVGGDRSLGRFIDWCVGFAVFVPVFFFVVMPRSSKDGRRGLPDSEAERDGEQPGGFSRDGTRHEAARMPSFGEQ